MGGASKDTVPGRQQFGIPASTLAFPVSWLVEVGLASRGAIGAFARGIMKPGVAGAKAFSPRQSVATCSRITVQPTEDCNWEQIDARRSFAARKKSGP